MGNSSASVAPSLARIDPAQPPAPADDFLNQATALARELGRFAGAGALWATALSAVAALFESIGLVLLIPLLSIVTAVNGNSTHSQRAVLQIFDLAGAQTRTARLSLLLGVFVLLIVVRAILVARRDTTFARLQLGFVEHVRARVAYGLAAAPWPVVSRLQHARVTHLMSGGIQRIGAAANCLVQILTASVLTILQGAVALLLAPSLTGLALVLIAMGCAASFLFLDRAHNLGARSNWTGITLMHETTQFLGALKIAAGQNRQADFIGEFEASLSTLKAQQLAFARQQALSRLGATIISGVVAALIALLGLTVLDTPPPVLIAMLLIFIRISGPAMQIGQTTQRLANTLPAYEEVCRIIRELAAAKRPTAASPPRSLAPGPIVLRNVSFRYQKTPPDPGPIIDLNLTIHPGSFIGISGPSGVGKTTFADLLIGLLEPDSGEITVGGTPLRGPAAADWRDRVSYVAQDPYLFRDTIRRNLLWANPQAAEAELWEALAIADAAALVSGMESRLDKVLGERGTLISGGERQRLCLARAVVRRPWLFVLDEATSALDVRSEREILRRIHGLNPTPTIVMIAHREESLANCDRIFRFRSGMRLIEQAGAAAG